ncbi:MATE family efflux transporter [Nocardia sp. NPDC047648]|uniref:MATE family efflux transporter n=1 Tax=Nocardia sp. NPDC047648 TaxID=3155625 RepID=UPI0034080CF1
MSTTIFLISMVTVGFGAVDMLMIAPKGVEHIAAVSQGDLIYAMLSAFFLGAVDVFGSRFAMAESNGERIQRLPALAAAFAAIVVVYQLASMIVAAIIPSLLRMAHQPSHIVALVSDYLWLRCAGMAVVIVYACVAEALKVSGRKNHSLVFLIIGFSINVLLDWAFLYTRVRAIFSSPEQAVAVATVLAQIIMTVLALGAFIWVVRSEMLSAKVPVREAVRREFPGAISAATGIGVRHLNDYVGSVLPVMFIGTLGAAELAAAGIAAKIYTLFCRVPQACVSAAFVFYCYALGRREADLAGTRRRLLAYSAVPTAVFAVATLLLSGPLVSVFSGAGTDRHLAESVLWAFLIPLPAYLIQAFYGDMLAAHQSGVALSLTSTVTTYVLTIPLAAYSVFVLHSPFLAILACGVEMVVLATLFARLVLRHDDILKEVNHAQSAGFSSPSGQVIPRSGPRRLL